MAKKLQVALKQERKYRLADNTARVRMACAVGSDRRYYVRVTTWQKGAGVVFDNTEQFLSKVEANNFVLRLDEKLAEAFICE